MSYGIIHTGDFVSRTDVVWRVELLKRDAATATPGDLSFPAETPVVVEWPEPENLLAPIQASTATLRLFSPSDRAYVDLYTLDATEIKMNLSYRDEQAGTYILYWSGVLDTEQYEEPYSYRDGYIVSLAFSDFGVLSRLKFTPSGGIMSVSDILEGTKTAAAIPLNITVLSSLMTSNSTFYENCRYDTLNFMDDDGVYISWREVLASVLSPASLRITQRAGKIYVYDLRYLRDLITKDEIIWRSTDSTLAASRTYNNIKITLKAGKRAELLKVSVTPSDITGTGTVQDTVKAFEETGEIYDSFMLETVQKTHPDLVSSNLPLFRTVPLHTDCSTAGIALLSRIPYVNQTTGTATYYERTNRIYPYYGTYTDGSMYPYSALMFDIRKEPYIYPTADMADKYWLKLSADLFLSYRPNPFMEAGYWNREREPSTVFIEDEIPSRYFLGFRLKLTTASGQVMRYVNENIVRDYIPVYAGNRLRGTWELGDYGFNDYAWLCWYPDLNGQKLHENPSWTPNRRAIHANTQDAMNTGNFGTDGEYIPVPPVGGKLTLTLTGKVWTYSPESWINLPFYTIQPPEGFHWLDKPVWVFLNNIRLSVADEYFRDAETDDEEYAAEIAPLAMEDVSEDQICGTPGEPHPTATCQPLDNNFQPYTEFKYGSLTGKLEDLHCSAGYTHYAGRHKTLSGTVDMLTGLRLYTDARDAAPVYGAMSYYSAEGEVQDIIEGQSQAVLVEVGNEIYGF